MPRSDDAPDASDTAEAREFMVPLDLRIHQGRKALGATLEAVLYRFSSPRHYYPL